MRETAQNYLFNLSGKVLSFLYLHKYLRITLIIAILFFSIWGILHLEIEADARKFLPQDIPERQANQKIKELYGVDAEMIIAYEAEDISAPQVVALIQQIVNKLQALVGSRNTDLNENGLSGDIFGENIPELSGDILSESIPELSGDILNESAPESSVVLSDNEDFSERPLIKEIQAINTVSVIQPGIDGELEHRELQKLTGTPLKQNLKDWNLLYDKAIHSSDFRYGAIIIQPHLDLNATEDQKLYHKVQDILKLFEGQGVRFFLSGDAAITSAIGDYILTDLLRLLPILALIICTILYSYFRKISALFIILFPVTLALLVTIGLMGWLGIKFTFIHASIPVIVTTLGCADAIHILNYFIEYIRGNRKNISMLNHIQAVQRALLIPIILTSITTSIGFLSFANSTMLPIRSFGFFSAIGIILACLSSILIAPLLLPLYSPRSGTKQLEVKSHIYTAKITWNLTHILLRHPYISRLLLLLGIVGVSLSIPYVNVNNDTLSYFRPNTPIVKSSKRINKELSGVYNLHISIQAENPELAVTEPELLQYMNGLSEYLKQQNPELIKKNYRTTDICPKPQWTAQPTNQFKPKARFLLITLP